MKHSLTNSEIARVFAMHLGCDIMAGNISGKIYGIYEYSKEVWVQYGEELREEELIQYCKLLLTPLQDITDEHLIQIGKIWHSDYQWSVVERDNVVIVVECEDYRYYLYLVDLDFIGFEERFHGKENIEAHGGTSQTTNCEDIVEIIDTMREWGYALPYKGQSLFESGIAIAIKQK